MSISEDSPLEQISALVRACLQGHAAPASTIERICDVLSRAGYGPSGRPPTSGEPKDRG